nr:MAG TPA: hypothetical protein [Bacteriophage sp.]
MKKEIKGNKKQKNMRGKLLLTLLKTTAIILEVSL